MYGQYIGRGQGMNSLSIVGRLSTLQSVHYQRFHCILNVCDSSFLSSLPSSPQSPSGRMWGANSGTTEGSDPAAVYKDS